MHVEYIYNTPWKFLFGADVKKKEITNYGKTCFFMILFAFSYKIGNRILTLLMGTIFFLLPILVLLFL